MTYIIQILLGYILADLLSGIYHFFTDRGYNIKSQVDLFQRHHDVPEELDFDYRPMVIGIPFLLMALAGFYPLFWIVLGSALSISQFIHYYTHQTPPAPIAFLQKFGIIMGKVHHDEHHKGEHDANYCIISGWNNWWMNKVIKLCTKSR